MKSRTIILILLTCLLSMGGAIFAQNAPIDFEVGGNGADWTWIVAEDGTNPALDILANPVSGGINTTATVAKFTAELAGQPWALFHSEGIGEFTFDATNSTVKIMVNKPVISNVGLKFEGVGPVLELTVPNTLINEWEELTFDFSSLIGNTYNKIVVIPDFDFTPRAQENIVYLDNVTFSEQIIIPDPGPYAPVDFEVAGNGADWEWIVAENGTNPALEILVNPVSGGINTSATVAKFTAELAGQPWALFHSEGIGVFTFDATNSTVKMMVNKPVISNVGLKFEGVGPVLELTVPNTLINEWEELTFDFSSLIGNTYNKIVVIPDFDFTPRAQENIVYLDNVTFSEQVLPTGPTVAAPAPTIAAEDVISVYSDVYTDIAGTNFNPDWGQATVQSEVQIAGNNTLLYSGLNYQGTILGSTQDVSGKGFLHVDFWSTNSTVLEVFLISETTGERTSAFTVTNDNWVSTDIPLTTYSDQGLALADIKELKFVGNGDVYIDNIFFHGDAVVEPFPGLFFSEYAEGSVGNNKYVEIYNPTGADVDLSTYSVQGSNNGSAWGADGTRDVSLSGTLAAGDVYVIAADQANADILAQTDLALAYPSPVHHNGNDGIALLKDGVIIDAIGVENVDPGVAWDVAGVLEATKDHTLIRKNDVMYGNIGDWAMSAGTDADNSQWVVAQEPTDVYTPPTLGWHIDPPVLIGLHAPIDFEVDGHGADWIWTVAENGTNPALEVLVNPVSGGINTTATVAKFTAELAGQPWALFHSDNIGEFTFDATNSTVKIMVNKPVISNVGLKFEGAGPVLELTVPNTLINEWEELTFDFSSLIGNTYNKIVVIPDFDFTPRAQENIVYLDNVTFSEQIIIPDPGPYAPVDFEVAGHGADWEWTVTENGTNPALEILANPMSGGINTSATVAKFTAELAGQPWALFHSEGIGVFTFDATNSTVKIMVNKPVISNVGLKFEGVGPVLELTVPNTLINEWEELTFDFSSLIGNTYNRIVVIPDFDFTPRAQDNIVYLDNVTFSEQIIIPDPGPYAPIDFEVGGNGADWTWIVAEDGTNPALEILANPMSGGINTSATVAKFTAELAGQPWALFHSEGIGVFTFDATNSTVKMMVNKPVISNVGLKFEGIGPVLELTVPNTLINEWEELTFDFSSLIGNTYNRIVVIPDFDFTPRAQENIVYLDNVTFSEQVLPTGPTVAAPAPMHDAADVMSIYSEAYTNLAGTNFNPNWGQSTVVTVDEVVAGTNTLKYESLNYQGTNLGGADGIDQDVSGYDYLHVDFWTANAPALNFFLISRTTGEQAFALPITPGEWVSMEIPLAHYVDLGLSLTDIFQFKVDGGDGATSVWYDNWYFYSVPPVEPLDIAGIWVVAPEAAALMVGPNPNDGSWWSNSADDVTTRACFFDDKFVFNEDGSFANVMDGDTWLETWQGVQADGCGAPIAPHDGSNAATYASDAGAGTVTLNGVGSYLGIPKAFNGGELGNPADAPASITYDVMLSDNNETMTAVLDIGGGYWTFKLVKFDPSDVVDNVVPDDFALKQNYPNPFNPSTTIRYSLIESGHVVLKLFNIRGQEVTTLVNGMASPGEYAYYLDASDLAAGTYLYAITAGNQTIVKKMVLIK